MTHPEAGKLSYIRASRELTPSNSLKRFLKFVRRVVEDEDFGTPNLDIPDPLVYSVNSLRLTLFERRVPATDLANADLRKAYDYLQDRYHFYEDRKRLRPGGPFRVVHKRRENQLPAALRSVEDLYVPDKEALFVRSNSIVDCTKDDFRHLGTELGLKIETGAVADALLAQSDLINDAFMGIRAAKRLPRPVESDDPLVAPFMRMSFDDDDARNEFMKMLGQELPVYDVGVEPIAYQNKIV